MSSRKDAQRAAKEAKRQAAQRIDQEMHEDAAAHDREFQQAIEEWKHHHEGEHADRR
jgi:hypothetical protein